MKNEVKTRKVYSEEKVADYFDELQGDYEKQTYGYMRNVRISKIKNEVIGNQVLDIGCNCGDIMRGYVGGKKAVGVDLSMESLKHAKSNVKAEFVLASASKLPFLDESFECIICSETLYYLEDPDAFVRKAWDKLKFGGKLVVVFSNDLYTRLGKIFGPLLGIRIKDIHQGTFYPQEVLRMFRRANYKHISHKGFAVVPMKGMEFFDVFFPT